MKLEKIALITNNEEFASFFEMELALLPYVLKRYRSVSELDGAVDCIVVDNDTVKDAIGGYSCPIVNVSSYFEGVGYSARVYTLPWPTPISAIGGVFRAIEHEDLQTGADKSEAACGYNTVYVTDKDTNSVMVENVRVKLTPNELSVLDALCSAKGELVEREQISQLLGADQGNMAEVYICRLRKKLEDPLGRRLIFAVRGKGYRTVLAIKK